MRFSDAIKGLNIFERLLWFFSILTIIISATLLGGNDPLSVCGALIGVTALIFVAKGHILGQILTLIFSIFYGIVSYRFNYFGEMITYMLMTAPMSVVAIVTWSRHPYKESSEVEVAKLSVKKISSMIILTIIVTSLFYFILRFLGNANLGVSTISLTTSFLAVFLTACRSPYYAIAYAANDIVLIILWISASISDIKYISMVACFCVFLINDIYGFINWKRMRSRQNS